MHDDDFDRRQSARHAELAQAVDRARVPGRRTLVEAEQQRSHEVPAVPGKRTLLDGLDGSTAAHADARDPVTETEFQVRKAREVIAKLAAHPAPAHARVLKADLSCHIEYATRAAALAISRPDGREVAATVFELIAEAQGLVASLSRPEPRATDPMAVAQSGIAATGERLPFQDEIQRSFGRHDIAGIRAHIGGPAADASRELGAHAYTHGNDIAFASAPSLALAAHEAAHVVQQRAGVSLKGIDGGASDPHEQHADAVADRVVRGQSAEDLLDAFRGSPSSSVVQRSSGAGAANASATPEVERVPDPGDYLVEVDSNGDYILVFNAKDLQGASDPAFVGVRAYLGVAFPGATDAIVREFMDAYRIGFTNSDPFPPSGRYEVHIHEGLESTSIEWMHDHHPEYRYVPLRLGKGNTRHQSANKGRAGRGSLKPSNPSKPGAAATAGTDPVQQRIDRTRALFQSMQRSFPEARELKGNAAWPGFLAFVAEHADEYQKLLAHTKVGGTPPTLDELHKLLEAYARHIQPQEGDSSGDLDGHVDGQRGGGTAGTHEGDAREQRTGGIKDGSIYGEQGGSKYGWARWEPMGRVMVSPQQPTYVAGSQLAVELKWDLSVHPNAADVLLAHHCEYEWTLFKGGKAVTGGAVGRAADAAGEAIAKLLFTDGHSGSVTLGDDPGDYEIRVTATSKHFKTKNHEFTASASVKVVSEDSFQKAAFEATQVTDPNAAFERAADGKLHVRKGATATTAADRVREVGGMRGQVDAYAAKGAISAGDQKVADEQLDKAAEALIEIEDKTHGGTPYIVRGTFTSREDSSTVQLQLLMSAMSRSVSDGAVHYSLLLHDTTMGDPVRHPGKASLPLNGRSAADVYPLVERAALEDMLDDFHGHNKYPKGKVHLVAQMLTKDEVWDNVADTNNTRKAVMKVASGIATAGSVLLIIVPGGGIVSAGLMVITTAAGGTLIANDIAERIHDEGKLKFDRRLLLDVLQVAAMALPFGGMLKIVDAASNVGRGLMYCEVALNGAQGFLIGADVREQLRIIDATTAVQLAGATNDEQRNHILAERDRLVAQVIGGAVVNGSFILIATGGTIKHLTAMTAGGAQFEIREPVGNIAKGGSEQIQQTLANNSFEHEGGQVELTADERSYLEHELAAAKPQGNEATSKPNENNTPKTRGETGAPQDAATKETTAGGASTRHEGHEPARTATPEGHAKPPPENTSSGPRKAAQPLTPEQQKLIGGRVRAKAGEYAGETIDPSFLTEEQEDAARWQTHAMEETATEPGPGKPEQAEQVRQWLNDPEFRHWYDVWMSMPDRVLVDAHGQPQVQLPHGVPTEIGAHLQAIGAEGNIGLMTRALDVSRRIEEAFPGLDPDPRSTAWQRARPKMVEMLGEAQVAKYEAERTSTQRPEAREKMDARLDELLKAGELAKVEELAPGAEIYVTGSAVQVSKKLNTVTDLDVIVVVAQNTPQRVRVELEQHLQSVKLQGKGDGKGKELPLDAKVMTQEEFMGYSMLETPRNRTPLDNYRIDSEPAAGVPGTGRSGIDLHNHVMGVPATDYFVDKVGGGSAVVTLETTMRDLADPAVRAQVTPGVYAQLEAGFADVEQAKKLGMPHEVVEARARRALDGVLSANKKTPFDATYDVRDLLVQKHIDPNGKFENFAHDVIADLHDQKVTSSEQSVSQSKLEKRFTPETMDAAHQRARAEGKDTEMDFLVMAPTNKTLSSKEASGETVEAKEAAKRSDEALRKLLLRKDVKGMDVAGPESAPFTKTGMDWFKNRYKFLEEVAAQKNQRMVLRPHAGEGYDPAGTGEHVGVARLNLDMLAGALEELGYNGSGNVIVRLGHATHATPEILERLANMSIIVEANVGSNLATGSVLTAEEHPLLANMYYGVKTVLATDAQGVMSTTLPAEYQRAAYLIAKFREGSPLQLGNEKVFYKELTPEQQQRFSVEWLERQAAAYREHVQQPISSPSTVAR